MLMQQPMEPGASDSTLTRRSDPESDLPSLPPQLEKLLIEIPTYDVLSDVGKKKALHTVERALKERRMVDVPSALQLIHLYAGLQYDEKIDMTLLETDERKMHNIVNFWARQNHLAENARENVAENMLKAMQAALPKTFLPFIFASVIGVLGFSYDRENGFPYEDYWNRLYVDLRKVLKSLPSDPLEDASKMDTALKFISTLTSECPFALFYCHYEDYKHQIGHYIKSLYNAVKADNAEGIDGIKRDINFVVDGSLVYEGSLEIMYDFKDLAPADAEDFIIAFAEERLSHTDQASRRLSKLRKERGLLKFPLVLKKSGCSKCPYDTPSTPTTAAGSSRMGSPTNSFSSSSFGTAFHMDPLDMVSHDSCNGSDEEALPYSGRGQERSLEVQEESPTERREAGSRGEKTAFRMDPLENENRNSSNASDDALPDSGSVQEGSSEGHGQSPSERREAGSGGEMDREKEQQLISIVQSSPNDAEKERAEQEHADDLGALSPAETPLEDVKKWFESDMRELNIKLGETLNLNTSHERLNRKFFAIREPLLKNSWLARKMKCDDGFKMARKIYDIPAFFSLSSFEFLEKLSNKNDLKHQMSIADDNKRKLIFGQIAFAFDKFWFQHPQVEDETLYTLGYKYELKRHEVDLVRVQYKGKDLKAMYQEFEDYMNRRQFYSAPISFPLDAPLQSEKDGHKEFLRGGLPQDVQEIIREQKSGTSQEQERRGGGGATASPLTSRSARQSPGLSMNARGGGGVGSPLPGVGRKGR